MPEDADPDVEELAAIDDELSTPEPPDEDDDRPWENYVKTEADVEADAFFAAFDSGEDDTDDDGTDHAGPGPDDPGPDQQRESEAGAPSEDRGEASIPSAEGDDSEGGER